MLAEDERMVRDAIALLLSLEPGIEVVAEVGRGDEVLEAATRARPDVLVLTTFERPGYLWRAIRAGASGFVLKSTPAPEFVSVVRRTAAGARVIDPALAAASAAEGRSPLSGAERDALAASADGADVASIARRLALATSTVRNRLSAAIQKLGARNRAEAARIAREKGWL